MKFYCKICHWRAKLMRLNLCIFDNQLLKVKPVMSSVAK